MPEHQLIPFEFETHHVSVVTDDHGEPWWIASEVCEILEIKNVSHAVARLDADEKNTITSNDALHSELKQLIVNESGLYALILGSRKKSAKTFKRWVTHEVLPQIRKTGSYNMGTKPVVKDPIIQMIIDLAVQLDDARVLAEQAQRGAAAANLKADLALAQQLWLTLREFAYTRQLTHQMPLSVCKDFGTYLTGYCLEHDIPVRDVPIAAKAWKHEHAYHVELIDQLLPKWLKRHNSQMAIVPSRTAKE